MRLYLIRHRPRVLCATFTREFSKYTIQRTCMHGDVSSIVYLCKFALTIALTWERAKTITQLLEIGADPDEVSVGGCPAILLYWGRRTTLDITLDLIRAGADTHPLLKSYENVRVLCELDDNIIKAVCRGIRRPLTKECASMAFVVAVTSNCARLCKFLKKNGADLDIAQKVAIRGCHSRYLSEINKYNE